MRIVSWDHGIGHCRVGQTVCSTTVPVTYFFNSVLFTTYIIATFPTMASCLLFITVLRLWASSKQWFVDHTQLT